jgi:hypothetical protein
MHKKRAKHKTQFIKKKAPCESFNSRGTYTQQIITIKWVFFSSFPNLAKLKIRNQIAQLHKNYTHLICTVIENNRATMSYALVIFKFASKYS